MKTTLLGFLMLASVYAYSQPAKTPAPPLQYGTNVSQSQVEKMMAAAIQEATRNGWPMAIAIVDTGGNLIAFERLDNTQIGSIDVAIGKAKTANNFKRPTKVLEDAIAGGGQGMRLLTVPGVVALEGGEPILYQGKVIGGIGVSGMASGQDDQVAKAGLNALN